MYNSQIYIAERVHSLNENILTFHTLRWSVLKYKNVNKIYILQNTRHDVPEKKKKTLCPQNLGYNA